ncbi:hypothetical protein DEO72_LG4g220 [Vigna unguiculata]|uniref:Uncharacterized protein n=1 Tax=Vigna unguiculata TaxID=3917 RepID=A0A4D6LLZ8_VIGUN|nr:hypothetical protein DEO72_LG4g220 [Vigna unguiculata]
MSLREWLAHWRRKNGKKPLATLSVNGDETAETDWVTTAKGSVRWSLRDPIAVAGAAVVSCRDHDAFLSCKRKRSWVVEALTSTSTPTLVDFAGEPITRWCDEGARVADSARTRSA